jgi:hypothetical protein
MMASAMLVAGCLVVSGVHADVYTWVDVSGSVNVSNLPPPAGARLLNTTRESAAAKARIEAARDAARHAEIKVLADRVAELESRAAAAPAAPVSYAPPPPVVALPTPAPSPSVVVVMAPTPAYDPQPAPTPVYGCAWVGCPLPWTTFGFPPTVFVNTHPGVRHGPGMRGSHDHAVPPRGRWPTHSGGRGRRS